MPQTEGDHYDSLEARDPAQRDAAMLAALPGFLRHALDHAPAMVAHLGELDPDTVTSLDAFAALPLLRKSDLAERQRKDPPFGGLTAAPLGHLAKVFMSPGPIFDPEGDRPDYWRFARALHAAGFRRGDLVHNAFAYHLTPAGSMIESGARALGCPVIPAGTSHTERQLEVIGRLRPRAYAGTPSFLKVLLERGRAEGVDVGCFRKALVSGEAVPQSLAEELQRESAIDAYQCYGVADLGLIAYETEARAGLVADEDVLVEIVRPGAGDPVPDGEVGEVVVTAFNLDYPLIRFATGDLSALLVGPSPCGRTNRRLRGWLGRADQSTKIKGMFVHPSQVAEIVGRHPEVGRAQLVVERVDDLDRMTLQCEIAGPSAGLEAALEATLRAVTGLRGEVRLLAGGALANDGKVIDDRREPG
jgi:phenylacetate-CoA ligase